MSLLKDEYKAQLSLSMHARGLFSVQAYRTCHQPHDLQKHVEGCVV